MRKLALLFFFAFTLLACKNKSEPNRSLAISNPRNSATYKGLHGIWALNSPDKKPIIEIVDTANVLFYPFYNDTTKSNDTLHGTLRYFNDSIIFIHLPSLGARFDYMIKGDTLQEFDKMGKQGTYIRIK